jgi:hypothetical protein
MSSVAVGNETGQAERVHYGRLPLAGLAAIAGAVVANLLVQAIAVALLRPDPVFLPLQPGPPVFFSVIGVLGAIVVYAIIGRFSRRPLTLFRRVALVTLLISLIPNILMLVSQWMPGATLGSVITLMVMHVVAWFSSVEALTRLAGERA